MKRRIASLLLIIVALAFSLNSFAADYDYIIDDSPISVTGKGCKIISVNKQYDTSALLVFYNTYQKDKSYVVTVVGPNGDVVRSKTNPGSVVLFAKGYYTVYVRNSDNSNMNLYVGSWYRDIQ